MKIVTKKQVPLQKVRACSIQYAPVVENDGSKLLTTAKARVCLKGGFRCTKCSFLSRCPFLMRKIKAIRGLKRKPTYWLDQ